MQDLITPHVATILSMERPQQRRGHINNVCLCSVHGGALEDYLHPLLNSAEMWRTVMGDDSRADCMIQAAHLVHGSP